MRTEDIQEYLRPRPFSPFRVTLTDGRTYDVRHPDMAMLGRSSITIGIPREGDVSSVYDRVVTVALIHVMQIDALAPAA